jgi:hypothetical protein
MMISSWQVGKLVRQFGPDMTRVAAGYHQGAGAVSKRIAAGKPIIDPKLQPKGAVYVARAAKVLPLYQGVA